MPRVMVVVGSVRDGRVGLSIAEWVRSALEKDSRFDIDWADLKEINLPMMTEPNHPRLRQYTQQQTREWSERVEAADAFIFVQAEYNYSYPAPLKNALDYLSHEWWRKPLGSVSYGGVSAGTRSVTALRVPALAVGLVPTGANMEISFPGNQIDDMGVFEPTEHQAQVFAAQCAEIVELDATLAPLRAAHAVSIGH